MEIDGEKAVVGESEVHCEEDGLYASIKLESGMEIIPENGMHMGTDYWFEV